MFGRYSTSKNLHRYLGTQVPFCVLRTLSIFCCRRKEQTRCAQGAVSCMSVRLVPALWRAVACWWPPCPHNIEALQGLCHRRLPALSRRDALLAHCQTAGTTQNYPISPTATLFHRTRNRNPQPQPQPQLHLQSCLCACLCTSLCLHTSRKVPFDALFDRQCRVVLYPP